MELRILAGTGPGFGSGHAKRAETLLEILKAENLPAKILTIDETYQGPATPFPTHLITGAQNVLSILDARDMDPHALGGGGPVIALDNQHFSRKDSDESIIFFDTIPHPNLPLAATLENCLLSPQVLGQAHKKLPRDGIFVYSGDFQDINFLDQALSTLIGEGLIGRVVRVGSGAPSITLPAEFEYTPELSREKICEELSRALITLTYFGMTMLEAWYLGSLPVLFSIDSKIHDDLSSYISKQAGLSFLKGNQGRCEGALTALREILLSPPELRFQPGGVGFLRLLGVIKSCIV